ncbi:MAG TPA: hypothetical protein VK620_36520, partial [Bradyrhizobium sp.]|nr:hypothetical protein [Bradyrhizobium sp.]
LMYPDYFQPPTVTTGARILSSHHETPMLKGFVMQEKRKNENDRKRDSDEPEQCTSTEADDSLLYCGLRK